jgi:hypothetical protein
LAGAALVIRQHGLFWQALNEMVFVGHSETGAVFEQAVQLIVNDTLKVRLRRIVVQLNQPTRDGDAEIALLSNLPTVKANALQIAALYQKRWRIERLSPQRRKKESPQTQPAKRQISRLHRSIAE